MFTNTSKTFNQEKPIVKTDHKDKHDTSKKTYTAKDLINKTAAENEKIKPTKNYLEADMTKSYKDTHQDVVSKPEFKSSKVESQEPHYVDIDKNQDVLSLLTLVVLKESE